MSIDSTKAFELGKAFALGVKHGRLQGLGMDENRWITVKPNGVENKGRPVEINEEGIVQRGMGGKYNGKHISEAHENPDQMDLFKQSKPRKNRSNLRGEAERQQWKENVQSQRERMQKEDAEKKASENARMAKGEAGLNEDNPKKEKKESLKHLGGAEQVELELEKISKKEHLSDYGGKLKEQFKQSYIPAFEKKVEDIKQKYKPRTPYKDKEFDRAWIKSQEKIKEMYDEIKANPSLAKENLKQFAEAIGEARALQEERAFRSIRKNRSLEKQAGNVSSKATEAGENAREAKGEAELSKEGETGFNRSFREFNGFAFANADREKFKEAFTGKYDKLSRIANRKSKEQLSEELNDVQLAKEEIKKKVKEGGPDKVDSFVKEYAHLSAEEAALMNAFNTFEERQGKSFFAGETTPVKEVNPEPVKAETPKQRTDDNLSSLRASPDEFTQKDVEDAYTFSSFNPERRAEDFRKSYAHAINSVYDELRDLVQTPEQEAIFKDQFEKFKQGYKRRTESLLGTIRAGANWAVTGPEKFNVRKNQKNSETEMRKATERAEYREKAINIIRKRLTGAMPAEQKANEAFNNVKKDLNSSLYNAAGKGFGDPALFKQNIYGRLDTIAKKGDTETIQRALDYIKEYQDKEGKAIFTPRHKIWQLADKAKGATQANAERMGRIEQRSETLNNRYEGVNIEADQNDNRLRLKFDGRPSQEVINDLKSSGWKWSPKNMAWQRQLTENANYSARKLLDKHYKKSDAQNNKSAPERRQTNNIPKGVPNSQDAVDSATKQLKGIGYLSSYGKELADKFKQEFITNYENQFDEIAKIDENSSRYGKSYVVSKQLQKWIDKTRKIQNEIEANPSLAEKKLKTFAESLAKGKALHNWLYKRNQT